MTTRDRTWLRSFLDLGARKERDAVPEDDILRQEDTVLRALAMLDERPGVVLADEVGMGKTYEALGLMAAVRERDPNARITILTPGPDLNRKWESELHRFGEGERPIHRGFVGQFGVASHLGQFLHAAHTHPIVVAPITLFSSGKGAHTESYLLSLYFHWKSLHGSTVNALLRRYHDGDRDVLDLEDHRFLGYASLAELEPHLKRAFTAPKRAQAVTLDSLYEEHGLDGFSNDRAVKAALRHARFQLVRRLIPKQELLVVDEAHKLKNAHTVRANAVATIFDKHFERAAFLTATPFQLHVGELRQVFNLFARARTAPPDLATEIDTLFAHIADYQDAYRAFETAWRRCDPAIAGEIRALYAADPRLEGPFDDPTHQSIAQQIRRLRRIKNEHIEPLFRSWMIRSLRESKRSYRKHHRHARLADGPGVLPFLLYERFIAELYRQGQSTHKVAVEINMASSFGAARTGALLSGDDTTRFTGDLADYQHLLRSMLDDLDEHHEAHPKTNFVVDDALTAAEQGDKTLVFCARVATLSRLARDLKAAWHTRVIDRWLHALPGTPRDDVFTKLQPNLRDRFQDPSDALYLALREPYCQTLLYLETWPLDFIPEITERANTALAQVRTTPTAASTRDYQIAKRCIEQATAFVYAARHPDADPQDEALRRLTHPDYLTLGLDLTKDDLERDRIGDYTPRWTIPPDLTAQIVRPVRGLWMYLRGALEAAFTSHDDGTDPWTERVALVERLARYLTYQDALLLPDLLTSAVEAGLPTTPIPSRPLLDHLPTFWSTPAGRSTVDQLNRFLRYYTHRDPRERAEILDVLLAEPRFVSQTRDGESRERHRRAFNTPLYPMILIANEVMQEGLDLHRSCARIVHHDLAWNPAQLEQRVGRIDRIGSLTAHRRKRDDQASLEVLYPLVSRTVDERMYRVVKTREKWLEFLLGAPPDLEAYDFEEVPAPHLPEGLAEELRVGLGPVDP